MSVLARKRKEGAPTFVVKGERLQRLIIVDILKDFGTRKHIRDIKFIMKNMDDEDKEQLKEFENCLDNLNKKADLLLPEHFLKYIRESIYSTLDVFNDKLIYIYSTWPTTVVEHEERLKAIACAIGCLFVIIAKYRQLSLSLQANTIKYAHMEKMILEEVRILKGLQKKERKELSECM